MENISFNIPSLGCSECSEKIRSTVKAITGVQNVSVNLKSQQLSVEFDPSRINADTIKTAVSEMGYDIT